jgi:hypothetical protein
MGSDVNDAKFPGVHIGWSGKYKWVVRDVILGDPYRFQLGPWFYTQSEMDAFLHVLDIRKANKTGLSETGNIALLQLSDGDLVDSGEDLNIFNPEVFDGGMYDDMGEI